MVKTVITIIVATIIFAGISIVEQTYVKKESGEFALSLETLYDKVDNETCEKQDVTAFKEIWLSKKKKLHVFIPHNDIKEVELWIGETMAFVEQKNYKEAISKLEVLRLLVKEIPKTFTFRLENVL